MVYTYNGLSFSLKRKESLAHAIWVNLEDIKLSEISQSQKDKYVWFHLYEVPRLVKFIKTENKTVVAKGWGRKGGRISV